MEARLSFQADIKSADDFVKISSNQRRLLETSRSSLLQFNPILLGRKRHLRDVRSRELISGRDIWFFIGQIQEFVDF